MHGSIPIPFPLDETLWAVSPSSRNEIVPCPECLGTKTLLVTQSNGAQFTIDCACCTLGFGPPRGVIDQTIMERRPVQFTPHRVSVNGEEITYSQSDPVEKCYSSKRAEDMFIDEAACAARCKELDAKDEAWRAEQATNNLKSKRHDLAWSVHYWQYMVRDLERRLEQAQVRLGLCKERKAKKAAKERSAA